MECMCGGFSPPLFCFAAKANHSSLLQVLWRSYGKRLEGRASTSEVNFHLLLKAFTTDLSPQYVLRKPQRQDGQALAGAPVQEWGRSDSGDVRLACRWNCVHRSSPPGGTKWSYLV